MSKELRRLQILDLNGEFQSGFTMDGTGFGQRCCPHGVFIAPNCDIFISDRNFGRVLAFDGNQNFKYSVGTHGKQIGQLDHPEEVALDSDGRIVVADTRNNRIQTFDENGVVVSAFHVKGPTKYDYSTPTGLVVTPDNHIYTGVNYRNNQNAIHVFDQQGSLIHQFGEHYSYNGFRVKGLFLDCDKFLWAWYYAYDKPMLKKFDSSGRLVNEINLPQSPGNLFVHNKRIYADFMNPTRLSVFTELGQELQTINFNYGKGSGEFIFFLGMALGPDGLIYCTDPGDQSR